MGAALALMKRLSSSQRFQLLAASYSVPVAGAA